MASRRGLGPSISFFAFQDIITAVVGIFILITLILVLELAQRVETATKGVSDLTSPISQTVTNLAQEVERLQGQYDQRTAAQSRTTDVNAFTREDKTNQLRDEHSAMDARLRELQSQVDRLIQESQNARSQSDELAAESVDLETDRKLIDELENEIRDLREQTNRLDEDDSPVYRDRTAEGRYVTLVTINATTIEIRDSLTRKSSSFTGGQRIAKWQDWVDRTSMKERQLFVQVEPGGAADFESIQSSLQADNVIYGYTVIGAGSRIRLGYETEAAAKGGPL